MHRLRIIVIIFAVHSAVAQSADLVPAYLLQLPTSVSTLFIAETDKAILHRYVVGTQGVQYLDARYMSIGKKGVGKTKAWDSRTPLGIYFPNEQLDTSGLHKRYGPTAFPLDYPNAWDRANQRSGSGIWIHGVSPDGGRRPPLDTDGCIALPNDELLAIEGQIVPLVTPVIITREIRWVRPAWVASMRAELNAALEAWEEGYRSGNMNRYLSLYAENFQYRGMSRDEWASYHLPSFARAVDGFSLDQILLLADPEDAGLYLTRFRQKIVVNARAVVTTKRLYWRRSADGVLRIVAEDNG